jgi:hypothetical protein
MFYLNLFRNYLSLYLNEIMYLFGFQLLPKFCVCVCVKNPAHRLSTNVIPATLLK